MRIFKWSMLFLAGTIVLGENAYGDCNPDQPETCIGLPPGGTTISPATLPIDLLPPGARALGIGGAFTAVADDSTAALANPAGLTNLTAPEVSIYVRYTDADIDYLDSDAYNSAVNALSGQEIKGYSDSSTDVSFASFVIPMEGVTFSLFYSNQLKFAGIQQQPDVYMDDIIRQDSDPSLPDFQRLDQYTNDNQVSGEVENIGLSAAFRLTDRFSLGLTVRRSSLDLSNSNTWQIDWWNDWEILAADNYYGFPASIEEVQSFLPVINDVYTYNTSINDEQSDLVLDLGLFYKGEQWSFGAVYHSGSKFTFNSSGSLASDFSCNPTNDGRSDECQFWVDLVEDTNFFDSFYPNTSESGDVVVRLPAVISFGTAFRPADTWLLSFDANYVKYGDLGGPQSTTMGFGIDINQYAVNNQFADPSIPQSPITEEVKDEWTFHVGGEKSFFFDSGVLRNLALRAGAFTVADYDGIVATDNDDVVWTVGLGTIWGKNEIGAKLFQVDLGASFADDVTNVVLSGIFRF